jgi:hypothetical protein
MSCRPRSRILEELAIQLLPARHYGYGRARRQQFLRDRPVTALGRHPGCACRACALIARIAAASWVKLNRAATAPFSPSTLATCTSDAQSIPATMPCVIAASGQEGR